MSSKFFVVVSILFCLYYSGFCGECTGLQNERFEECFYRYFDSFESEEDSDDYLKAYEKSTKTWEGIEESCHKFKNLQKCLGDGVIKNCISLDNFLEVFDKGMDMLVNFATLTYSCGRGFGVKKESFECLQKIPDFCHFKKFDCPSIKEKILQCSKKAEEKCGENAYVFRHNSHVANMNALFPHCNIQYLDEGVSADVDSDAEMKLSNDSIDDAKIEKLLSDFGSITKLMDMLLLNDSKLNTESIKAHLPYIISKLKSMDADDHDMATAIISTLIKKDSEYAHVFLEAIPILINNLKSPNEEISTQAAKLLQEITEISHRFRNFCFENGIVEIISKVVFPGAPNLMLENIGKVLLGILGHTHSSISDEIIASLLPSINVLLFSEDPGVEFFGVVSYSLLLRGRHRLQIPPRTIERMLLLFRTTSDSPLLRILFLAFGRYVDAADSEARFQYMIDNGFLKAAKKHLKNFNEDVKEEAVDFFETTSKQINPNQIDAIFEEENLLLSIIALAEHKNDKIRESAIKVVYFFVNHGNAKQITSLVDEDIIYPLCSVLKEKEHLAYILETLKIIFIKSNLSSKDFFDKMNVCGGFKTISVLNDKEQYPEYYKIIQFMAYDIADAKAWESYYGKKKNRDEL